jgi:hypothetical protein
MDMHSRKEYLQVLREKYIKAQSKKEKSQILDEYCGNTGQVRKYVIRRIQARVNLCTCKKKRKALYDGEVTAALVKIWSIFDYPCGQRLKPILTEELDRLIRFGEIVISEEVFLKLKVISSATIDRKLKHQREVLRLLQTKTGQSPTYILKPKIAIRLTAWDTSIVGYNEMDLVAHGGSSAFGDFVNTLSNTEIYSGWWEGEAIMGKSQEYTFYAIKNVRERSPYIWKGADTDNGSEFINNIMYKYCDREKLEFTRSRASRKNDNAYIEEKNWTHVRKVLGYLRYDTPAELNIINELYRGDLRLYKNFFQPVMKLFSKERIGGKVKRRYDTPKTPFQRLIQSGQMSDQTKKNLEALYRNLNPAQLKRNVDNQLEKLFQIYELKRKAQSNDPMKKVQPRTVTSLMIKQQPFRLPI